MNNINNIFNISNIADIDNDNGDGEERMSNIGKDKNSKKDFSNVNELNILRYNKLRKMKRRLYENKYDDILEFLLNRSIPKRTGRIKITNDNFFTPDIDNYKMLLEYDFKLNDLKSVLKHYSLKTTGTKELLLVRIYNYLDLTSNIVKLQARLRGHFVSKYILLQGPARNNREKCINCNDFCTMMDLKDIPLYQFFSLSTESNYIYGFDIMSIYNLFLQGNNAENPYTKSKFGPEVLAKVLEFIRYSKLLKMPINTNFCDLTVNNDIDSLNLRAISIFHKINMLGNYANSYWFTSLSRENLVLFVKELIDIWEYRANLLPATKRDICPPNGNPFKNIVNSNINNYEFVRIKKIATTIIDNMVSNGIDDENKKLGAFYVLSGLTLVNIDAANALPWLYQSVMHG